MNDWLSIFRARGLLFAATAVMALALVAADVAAQGQGGQTGSASRGGGGGNDAPGDDDDGDDGGGNGDNGIGVRRIFGSNAGGDGNPNACPPGAFSVRDECVIITVTPTPPPTPNNDPNNPTPNVPGTPPNTPPPPRRTPPCPPGTFADGGDCVTIETGSIPRTAAAICPAGTVRRPPLLVEGRPCCGPIGAATQCPAGLTLRNQCCR